MKEGEPGKDLDLLQKIAGGDKKAFSEVYERFHRPLLRHVVSKVGNLSAAEDILHDLFFSLWNGRGRLVNIDSLPAYLYTSCRYLVFQYIKKNSAHESNIEWVAENIGNNEQSIEERLYYRYLLDIINLEIEDLPEKCKQVFKMSREELMTNKEIASALHISESTVENQINKAIKRIRMVTKHLLLFICLTPHVRAPMVEKSFSLPDDPQNILLKNGSFKIQ